MGQIKRYKIQTHSKAWYNFRRTGLTAEDCKTLNLEPYEGGIGASENGKILGLNKWRPVLAEMFHHKVGTETPSMENNAMTVNGLYDEEKIKLYWCLWNGTETGIWDNVIKYMYGDATVRKNLYVRNASRINAYLVNTDYPYLFASLDYYTHKGTPNLSGEVQEKGFPLECKTLNGYYAKQWETGIPEYHIAQANQQMIITETTYAEIVVLIDGRQFMIYPVYRNDDLCNKIIEEGKKFWDLVLEGREKFKSIEKAYSEGDMNLAEQLRSEIDSMEPEPDDTEAYEQYMKERFTKEQDAITGSIEDYDLAVEYKTIAEYQKILESKKQFTKNKLMKKMEEESTERLNFEEAGYVSFAADKGKKNPTFRNQILFTPNMEVVNMEVEKLNTKIFV